MARLCFRLVGLSGHPSSLLSHPPSCWDCRCDQLPHLASRSLLWACSLAAFVCKRQVLFFPYLTPGAMLGLKMCLLFKFFVLTYFIPVRWDLVEFSLLPNFCVLTSGQVICNSVVYILFWQSAETHYAEHIFSWLEKSLRKRNRFLWS